VPIKHETTKHEAERVIVRRIDESTTNRGVVEIARQENSIKLRLESGKDLNRYSKFGKSRYITEFSRDAECVGKPSKSILFCV
jgi:hypothetical protein